MAKLSLALNASVKRLPAAREWVIALLQNELRGLVVVAVILRHSHH